MFCVCFYRDFFFSSRRRHTRLQGDWSSDVCSSDLWRFLLDVVVFQIKMLLVNLRDFALMPVSLAAALIDLVIRGERERSEERRVGKESTSRGSPSHREANQEGEGI